MNSIPSKLLTIVVAAYNKQDLLPRCLDSLLFPSVMDEVEVIVVNDGSEDNTSEVIKSYEARYPDYIIAIDKQNGNYGSVMNVALKQARGKYFRTLDADDYYDSNVYERYIEQLRLTDADLVLSERHEIKERTNWHNRVSFDDKVIVYQDLPIEASYWDNKSILSASYVMGMCYKTELIRQSGLVWTENIFYTDAEYCLWPLPLVKTIRFVPLPLYVFVRDVEGHSTSMQNRYRYFDHYVMVARKSLQYFQRNKDNVYVYDLFVKFIVTDLLSVIYQTLYIHGLKNKLSIDEIEALIKPFPVIYSKVGNFRHYRNIRYVDAYRNNRIKYWIIRFDYMFRFAISYLLMRNE